MNVIESLTSLNLTDREARLYSSLLELGQATPLQLANKTGLKRPTVYLDLESLRRKQLAGLTFKGKKTYYVAESPQKLWQHVREQERALTDLMPLLKAIENRSAEKPRVRMYTGRDEISNIWKTETWSTSENWFISNVTTLTDLYDQLLPDFQAALSKGLVKRSWELVPPRPKDIEYAQKYHASNRQIRILPQNIKFDIDISMWGDNLGLYSFKHNYILVITDTSIVQAFKGLYQIIWNVSKTAKSKSA